MEHYNRLAAPHFRRITIRISIFEIELRARPQVAHERPSPEERAFRREQAQVAVSRERSSAEMRWALRA